MYNDGVILKYTCGAFTEIILLLLLTPTIYMIMAFRTGLHLYGGLNAISSERLIHTDMIIHVSLDFLDIIDISNTFSIISNALHDTHDLLQIFAGVVVATCVFLHAYSFPRMSEASKENMNSTLASYKMQSSSNSKCDIYFCRKYAAIVGIFFVDVPFGIFRFTAWLLLARHEVFAPFLLKNICCIALQAQRIKHCSIGINSKSNSSDEGGLKEEHSNQEGSVEVVDKVNKDIATPQSRNSFTRDVGSVKCTRDACNNLSTNVERSIGPINAPASVDIPDLHVTTPVECKRILQKIILMLGVGSKPEMAHLIDSSLSFSLRHNVLLMLPHVCYWIAEFVIVVALYKTDRGQIASHFVSLSGISSFHWSSSPTLVKIALCTIGIASCINLFCWSFLGPFWDALFVAIFVFVRLVSYSLVLLSISEFVPCAYILEIVATLIMGSSRDYLFLIWGLRPFLKLLNGLYPFLCVTLGKSTLFYINPSVFYTNKSDLFESVRMIGSFSNTNNVGMDETCGFSLSALLILTNAGTQCASTTSHALLMSHNLIKSYRLNSILVSCHKRSIVICLVLRCYCILTVVGTGLVDYSFALIVYGVHVLLLLTYLALTLLQRLLALESATCQSMCLDILKSTTSERDEYKDLVDYEKSRYARPEISTSGDIYAKYQKHQRLLR
ncbi:CECR6-TMEM121 family [Babesia duncani]|uniref:CECR6-TMEM121 family n=1 Tax=Babesia duncani TaxID=323732 RepID=A0AAD9UNM2_9APIC|nr:CECR6-TMEM121 family [Babesia duncani]